MARDRDEDPWRRFRDREKKRQESQTGETPSHGPKAQGHGSHPRPGQQSGTPVGEPITALVERIDVLLEQVSNLYNQFFAGSEKLPPIERRKQLDLLVATLQSTPKAMSTDRFRATTTTIRWKTYSDRWDKQLKLLEQGKFKRRA